jgi:NADPH:quinone reductase-like Zn-dependent oxidoreductase
VKISGQWVSTVDVEQALIAACGDSVAELAGVAFRNDDGLGSIGVFAVPTPGCEQAAAARLRAGSRRCRSSGGPARCAGCWSCPEPPPGDAEYLIDATGVDTVLAGSYACSGLTSYSALKKLGPLEQEWIGIIGMGGVGLMGLAVAKGIGFEHVVAIDIDDAKLQTAKEYGADRTSNAARGDVVGAVTAEVGKLAGVVDFVGSGDTFHQAVGLLRGGGVSVTVGLFGGELTFPLPALAVQQLVLRGSFVGTLGELGELMELVRRGKVEPIPARPVPFTEVNDSIRELREGRVSGRIVLTHGGVRS